MEMEFNVSSRLVAVV